jgi:hypothetical protein
MVVLFSFNLRSGEFRENPGGTIRRIPVLFIWKARLMPFRFLRKFGGWMGSTALKEVDFGCGEGLEDPSERERCVDLLGF